MSFWRVIQKAFHSGHPYVMILQDDVFPTEDMDVLLMLKTIHSMESRYPYWEAVYLGYKDIYLKEKEDNEGVDSRTKIRSDLPIVEALCSSHHAIIISRAGMMRILSDIPRYWQLPALILPVDMALMDIWSREPHVCFAFVKPMIQISFRFEMIANSESESESEDMDRISD
jgi:GR25 family glycosyltransferase involved in LPS biosynthesis